MKIIITEPELTQIVRSHVLSTVQLQNGSDIAIDFSATRGADGVTATIDIPYVGVQALDLGATKAPDAAPKQEAKPPKAARIAPTAAAPATAPTQVQKAVVTDGVGIFAGAKAAADAVAAAVDVAEAPFELATEGSDGDTAAAVVEAGVAVADPGPGTASVSLFP